jgi:hypothetical protein
VHRAQVVVEGFDLAPVHVLRQQAQHGLVTQRSLPLVCANTCVSCRVRWCVLRVSCVVWSMCTSRIRSLRPSSKMQMESTEGGRKSRCVVNDTAALPRLADGPRMCKSTRSNAIMKHCNRSFSILH